MLTARSGSFGASFGPGGLTLTPFGGGRSSFGQYEFGDTLNTIEAMERYAASVGWQNGTVTDEDYLASLHRAIDLSVEGTRDRIAAQNAYDDAVYTIGRNKIVRRINNSATDAERITASQDLITYDQAKLATMVTDNEQRRELVDRIAGTQASIRDARWSQLVRRYNANEIGNQQMLDFAKRARKQADGAADQQQWSDRVTEFGDRIANEHLTQLEQDYQMDRVGGGEVLAYIDQRLSGMSPDSTGYADLSRHREDFAKAFHADEAATKYSSMYDRHQEGTITDDQWLTFLHQRVQDAAPGSDERRSAKHDLVMETYNITESRLYYDVAVNGASPNTLINFYRTTLATLDHNSARAHQIQKQINDLQLGNIESINLGGTAPAGSTPVGHHVPAGPGGGTSTGNRGGNSAAEQLISAAKQYLGMAYRLGGEGQNGTIDCSGLIYAAFKDAGYGALIDNQRRGATAYGRQLGANGNFTTDINDAQRGDLVVFNNPEHPDRYTHIGIYLGNGRVLSAVSSGVKITRVNGLGSTRPVGFVTIDYSRVNPTAPRHAPVHPSQQRVTVADVPDDPAPKPTGHVTQRDVGAPRVTDAPALNPGSPAAPRTNIATPTGPSASPSASGGQPLPGAARDVARELVRQLGGDPNNDGAVRAVAAWLAAENPSGHTAQTNNPLNLMTDGARDLPGQLNRTSDGYAIFGTWQQGIAAAAAEINRNYSPIAAAVRSGNPESILRGVTSSDWRADDYNGALIKTYNDTGPAVPIIGGTRIYNTPQSLGTLTRQQAEVSHLFEVDMNDPSNVNWFNTNMAALEDAYRNPSNDGKWTFTKPDGSTVRLAFAPEMYYEGMQAAATYARNSGDRTQEANILKELRNTRIEVTVEQFDSEVAALTAQADAYLLQGNFTGAVGARTEILAAARDLLGLPEGVALDTANYTGTDLDAQQLGAIQGRLNKLLPMTKDNPGGDDLLGMLDPGVAQVTRTGDTPIVIDDKGIAHPSPNAFYFTQDGAGNVVVHSWLKEPDQFDLVANRSYTGTGETLPDVPAYQNDLVKVVLPGVEVPIMVKPTTGDVNASIIDTGHYRDSSGNIVARPDQATITTSAIQDPGGYFRSMSPGLFPTQTQAAGAPNVSAQDSIVIPANGSVPTHMIRVYANGTWYQAYTLSDPLTSPAATWVFWDTHSHLSPPTPVISDSSKARIANGQLQVKDDKGQWVAWTGQGGQPGLDSLLHWYGTDRRDNAPQDQQGAPGQYLPTRTVPFGQISLNFDSYEREAMRSGQTLPQLHARDPEVFAPSTGAPMPVTPPTVRQTVAPPHAGIAPTVSPIVGFTMPTPTPTINAFTGFTMPSSPSPTRVSGSTTASISRVLAAPPPPAPTITTTIGGNDIVAPTPKPATTLPTVTPKPTQPLYTPPVTPPTNLPKPAQTTPTTTPTPKPYIPASNNYLPGNKRDPFENG